MAEYKDLDLNEAERKAKNEYMRNWHREKKAQGENRQKLYEKNYWAKKVKEQQAAEQLENGEV